MRGRSSLLLAGLVLLSSEPPRAAADEGGQAIHRPMTPTRAAATGPYVSVVDVDELKRALAQTQPPPKEPAPNPEPKRSGEKKPASTPEPKRNGEKVELTLEKSIETALKNNLDVRITQLGRDASETDVAKALAIFHPTAGLAFIAAGKETVPESGHYPADFKRAGTTNVFTQTATPFISTLLPTGASVILSGDFSRQETLAASPAQQFTSGPTISIVQPLFRGGRIYVATKPIRDAAFDLRIAGATLGAQILKVIAATKSAYYTAVLAQKTIAATEAAIERDKALKEASDALFKAGLVTKRDVFSAELSQAKDTVRLVNAQADLKFATNSLVDVIGLTIGTEPILLDRELRLQPVRVHQEEWIASAIRNRPEIMEVDERLKKSDLNLRTVRNALLPQVDFVATYGRLQTASSFGRSLDLGGQSWTAGILFSVPLGNVAAKAAAARAEIEYRQLQQQRVQRERAIELEVRSAVITLSNRLERMNALTVIVEQAKGKLEVAQARFALGQATNFDITDAQADLLTAETDLLKAIAEYNIALAQLEASVAGPI